MVKKFSQKEAKLLNQALAFCQQGNLQEGKNILQFLYSDFPNHPDVLSPLGAIKLQEGYIDDGIFKLAQSLKLNPRQPAALNNLGNAYLELKKYEEALIAFEKTIQMQPNFVDAHYNQGRAHSALKDYKKAILAYQKATDINSNYVWACINKGYCYFQLEQYEEAQESYKQALSINKNIPELQNNLALVYQKLGHINESVESFNLAIKLNPIYVDAYLNLGNVLIEVDDIKQAQQCFIEALKLDPKNLLIYEALFNTFNGSEDFDNSEKYINQALEIDPKFDLALFTKAKLLGYKGKFEEAKIAYNDLIAEKSEYTNLCFKHLAASEKIQSLDHPIFNQIHKFIENSDNQDDQNLYFALAKCYEDIKEYDKSFQYYSKANDLSLKKEPYNLEAAISHLHNIQEVFTKDLINYISDFQSQSELPIIIVGMPRSGTTLTEQIISSHPRVAAAGERSYWNAPPELSVIKITSKERWDEIKNNYLAHLKAHSQFDQNTLRITDKLPHNFLNLGLLASLFPKAKIIHCKRHPLDNCFSIFSLAFNKGHGYAKKLEYLGEYYLAYKALMNHWEMLFPNRILNIDYEKNVEDPEFWAKKMIEHVNLPWNEACLSPHKNSRSVVTLSLWQVRQPIYKTSVRRSDHFAKYLHPLKDILEKGGMNLS